MMMYFTLGSKHLYYGERKIFLHLVFIKYFRIFVCGGEFQIFEKVLSLKLHLNLCALLSFKQIRTQNEFYSN